MWRTEAGSDPVSSAITGRPAPPRATALRLYAGAVITAGLLGLVGVAVARGPATSLHDPVEFWLFAALLLVTELRPVTIQRGGREEATTISGIFACAIVLGWGAVPAVLVQGVASLAEDTVAGTAWWKRAFNVAQYTLSLIAAAAVLGALGGGPALHIDLAIALVVSLTFFAANNTITGIGVALFERVRVLRFLLDDLGFQASLNGALAALAPVVLVAANDDLWMVPLLLVPVAALYRGASVTLEKEHQATHDALTGLPNRVQFEARATEAVVAANGTGRHAAILMIDLDGLNDLNDTLGHRAGDLVLRQVGPRIAGLLDEPDLVARFGSDEFAVLLGDLASPFDATRRAEAIVRAFDAPFDVEGSAFDLKASMGLTLAPEHGRHVDQLLQFADVAMHVAKRNRSGCEVYCEDTNLFTRRRLTLLGELRQAIERRDLVVHYQPKADLASGRFTGLEALVRWDHPQLGRVMPDEFIGLAEHSGLIVQLSEYVLDTTLGDARRWRDEGIELPISVNISARSLHDESFPNRLARMLAVWGVPSRALVLELTETALMAEPERSLAVLNELSQMHVRLSIDDFGTGYSSLAYLKRLPVDEIKIDKSFVLSMGTDENDRIIVQSTIDLAHNLGLDVVAEGVETAETWHALADLGCGVAQGYLIGRPEAADELTARLRAEPRVAPSGTVVALVDRRRGTALA
jgi:diguanylate cyclase (GGDEF)-like protein